MRKSISFLHDLIQQQVDQQQNNFYFVLKRGDWETLQRYDLTRRDEILAVLGDLDYLHTRISIPYFSVRNNERRKNK
jgi:predicted phosphodiesterase